MTKISTSILGIKDSLEENISKVYDSITDYIHLDIMDGKFVLNKSFEFDDINKIYNHEKLLDIHFMVEDIIKYINIYKVLKPAYITIHIENENVDEAIKLIKENNIKVGLAIKPDTNIDKLYKYLDKINLILIMGVMPGFGGQKFIDNTIDRVIKLKEHLSKNNYNILISVDGGVNNINSKPLIDAGCDILVCGSYITNSNNYNDKIKSLFMSN